MKSIKFHNPNAIPPKVLMYMAWRNLTHDLRRLVVAVSGVVSSRRWATVSSSPAASGVIRAVSGRIVWWTSIIRSRVRWMSGGSSCIQRR